MSDDVPAAKRAGGRPPLQVRGARLTEIVRLRLTEAEADEIYRGALRAGLTLSDYLRVRIGLSVARNDTAA